MSISKDEMTLKLEQTDDAIDQAYKLLNDGHTLPDQVDAIFTMSVRRTLRKKRTKRKATNTQDRKRRLSKKMRIEKLERNTD